MKVGITGANGFVGSNIAEYLLQYDISVVKDIFNPDDKLETLKYDWILHFGAKTTIPKNQIEADAIYTSNINSTIKALSIAKKNDAAFLFLSSYVYGKPQKLPIDETHPTSPLNSYINSKLICEKICQYMSLETKSLIILRGFNIYGYGLKPGRLIHDIINTAIIDKCITINDGFPQRDYLYIDDLCELVKKIISKKKIIRNIYNIGSGISYSNLEIANIVSKITNIKSDINIKHNPRLNDVDKIYANIDLISSEYKWSPKIDIAKGLELTIKKYNKWN